jgi:plastocyanin
MTRLHSKRSLAGIVAAAIVLGGGGCGGGDDGGGGSTTASSSPSGASGGGGGGAQTIDISNFKFAPATITVPAGSKLTVKNSDTTAHTATADDGAFDTSDIEPGSSATITVKSAGSVPYHCSIHSFMHGMIVVH